MQRLFRAIGTWLIICIVGLTAGTIFWLLVLFGRIKIKGYWKTWRAILRGNHVILSNHPSMRDPFLLILMWWPWALILPHKFFIWNLPGKNYFGDLMEFLSEVRFIGAIIKRLSGENWHVFPEWAYVMIHSVPVMRDKSNARDVLRETKSWLKRRRTFVIFGETGRTGSKPWGPNAPPVEFVYSNDDNRKIRQIDAALIKAAAGVGAAATTVWIDMPFWEEDPSFGLGTWLRNGHIVTITLSDSFKLDKAMKAAAMNVEIGHRILAT